MMMTKYSINNAASVLIFFIAIMLIAEGGKFKFANAQNKYKYPGTWCVARPSADVEDLTRKLTSMCDVSLDPCPIIQPGGECFLPNTLYNYVSVALNNNYVSAAYYDCYGLIVITNPSYGSCNYKPSPAAAPPPPPGTNFELLAIDGYKHNLYCVPKPGASEQELIANIEYACSQLGNCTTINSTNGACFLPNTTLHHASVAMNMYYASQDRVDSACNFSNSGIITITDPSFDSCIFD